MQMQNEDSKNLSTDCERNTAMFSRLAEKPGVGAGVYRSGLPYGASGESLV